MGGAARRFRRASRGTSSSSAPLSRHSPWGVVGVGAGRLTGIRSLVSRTLLQSCRLAPSAARPMGAPPPSCEDAALRLRSAGDRSDACRPFSPAKGGVGQGVLSLASPSQSIPCQASHATRPLFHSARKPPASVHSWTAALGGTTGTAPWLVSCMPLAARAEHEQEGIQGCAILDTGPMAPQRMGLTRWEQRLKPRLQGGRETPVTAHCLVVSRHQYGSETRTVFPIVYHANDLMG